MFKASFSKTIKLSITFQAALAAAQSLVSQSQQTTPTQNHTPNPIFSPLDHTHSNSSTIQGGPNTVLRVIIEQMLYPVTLDVLYQIFSRVGKVLRIVTFTKNNYFQALIQYPDVVMAQAAKLVIILMVFFCFLGIFFKSGVTIFRVKRNA
jgi:hypothetical protein